jgi:hypothetical protein
LTARPCVGALIWVNLDGGHPAFMDRLSQCDPDRPTDAPAPKHIL